VDVRNRRPLVLRKLGHPKGVNLKGQILKRLMSIAEGSMSVSSGAVATKLKLCTKGFILRTEPKLVVGCCYCIDKLTLRAELTVDFKGGISHL